jgi:hypothetical protein
MVEESSAVLYVPNESRIPIMADHTTMVKFSYRDMHYQAVKTQLEEIIQSISDTSSQELISTPELGPFGLAFGLSGSTRWVKEFLSLYHATVAEYEATHQTDQGFILFRFQCWTFIAWAETMRAAWRAACESGLLLKTTKSSKDFYGINIPLLKRVKEVSEIMKEVYHLKKEHDSFELQDDIDGNPTRIYDPSFE